MAVFKRFGRKKGRRYHIKRDSDGKSARQRCFDLFKNKMPLPEIAKTVDVKIDTVRKYYVQWKKNPDIERYLSYYNFMLNKSAPDRERSMEITANLLGTSKEQLNIILQQPYGLRRLLSGKIYFPVQADAAHKRYVAMEIAFLISDHLLTHSGKFEDVYFAIEHWIQQNQAYREEEDEEIKEENKDIAFLPRIMEADLEIERQGRIQPARLSPAEQDIIRKWGRQSGIKKLEITYWLRIGELMVEGNTIEEAREKLYQDILNSGNAEAAKALRKYQDIIHPVKSDKHPPSAASEPPKPS